MSVTSIKQVRADRSDPLRVALAASLAAQAKADLAREARLAAISRARGLVAESEAAVEKAKAGTAAAKQKHIDEIAKSASSGTAPATPGKVREHRAKERDCEDDREAAVEACQRLEAGLADIEGKAAMAAHSVIAAANAVAAGAAEAALAAVRAARARYFAAAGALAALIAEDEEVPELSLLERLNAQEMRAQPLKSVKQAASNLLHNGPLLVEAERLPQFEQQQLWARWRRALRTDPDAVPPHEFAD
jgi:hypothetical protein